MKRIGSLLLTAVCLITMLISFVNPVSAKIGSFEEVAVTNVKATSVGTTSIRLTWNSAEGAQGYLIYRQIGKGSYGYRGMVKGNNVNSYTDTKAKTGEYNFYWVFPYRYEGENMIVGKAAPYVYATAVPASVKNLTASSNQAMAVNLTWKPVANVDGYIIYRRVDDGIFEYRYMVSGTAFTDTTAKIGKYNYYRIYPYKNVNGKKVLGASENYKYAKPVPAAVTNLKSVKERNYIKLTWNKASNVDGYIIYRQAPGETKMSYRYLVSSTSFQDTQIDIPGNYFYRVYAYKNDDGKRIVGTSNQYVYTNVPKTIKKYNEGMYKVGVNIPAGEYIVIKNGQFPGYYEVTNSASSSDYSNIVNNNIFNYNDYVKVSNGQYIKLERADMYPVNHAPDVNTSGEGVFKVGKDIKAGVYDVVPSISGTSAYYEIKKDLSGSVNSIVENDFFTGNRIVSVKDGQYLEISGGKIKR